MTDIPLIYTTQGNLPESELIFETAWDDSQLSVKIIPTFEDGQVKFGAKLEGSITCMPTWYLKNEDGSRGELVKRSVLVYHTGINAAAEQGQFN
jgi:hypothetical protein